MVIVIIGAQWGDEGKGKIVDLLAERFDIVARYQGGHNAGHSVQVGKQSFVLHLLPSGIVHEGKSCVLGNGMVIDPMAFFEEADRLIAQGIVVTPERVKISSRALSPIPVTFSTRRQPAENPFFSKAPKPRCSPSITELIRLLLHRARSPAGPA